jgi:iron(III) transport system permease protein
MLIPLPQYIHALTWSSIAYKFFGLSLQGAWASWWVQLVSLLPLSVGLSLIGLEAVEQVLIDAGRVVEPDIKVFKRIIIPQALPMIIAGASFLFLFTLMDYTVPSLFSMNVYPLEIFAEFSSSTEPLRALALGVPLLLIALAAIILLQKPLRTAAVQLTKKTKTEALALIMPPWFEWLQKIAIGIIIIQIIVPVYSLISSAGSFKNILISTANAKSEIFYSLVIAFGAGLSALLIAWPLAHRLSKANISRWWWFLMILPLVIPGSLVGVCLLVLVRAFGLEGAYSSLWMPVLANIIRFGSLAVIIILARLQRTDRQLLDAAAVHQRNIFQGWLKVKLPLMVPAVVAAGCIVFILSLGELAATIIVVPPGKSTLTIKIYNYLHYGSSSQVAGLCLVILLAVLSVTAFITAILHKTRGNHDFARQRQ